VTTSFKLHQIILVGLSLLVALSFAFDPKVLTWVGGCYLALSALSLIATKTMQPQGGAVAGISSLENDFNDLLGNRPWLVLFFFGLFVHIFPIIDSPLGSAHICWLHILTTLEATPRIHTRVFNIISKVSDSFDFFIC
jgi:hypothetical protein